MDPRDRADAILARARARGAYVVTPESAISPMDAAATLQIPRAVVSAIDNADATQVFPASRAEDELPAIAQEAATQSLASPGRPTERLPRQQPRQPEPEPVEGLVPTEKQPPASRPSLTQRLDGGSR
ncbi:hypothetical protein [Actinokineospora iranica]|uniref:Uncharacterized protein n=1 Tax=Actinokineospora iranica TaxID=1271860 RepID=A0A1G6SY24_9PSEU|nr:hypothetical protein [Actinokineospora iranica]SDD21156.1 hypothetical protein SAMN05216174_108219 [Actinokineospora iranica]